MAVIINERLQPDEDLYYLLCLSLLLRQPPPHDRLFSSLFRAEVGAHPRDFEEKTEEGRGETVSNCRTIFREINWDVWNGPSRYYN